MIAAVYASLVHYLEESEIIRTGPWDATASDRATASDLDEDSIARFALHARRVRNFPLSEKAGPLEILTHLNLLDGARPSHAAVLLFGRRPQQFIGSSEVKCAHFHGAEVAKPIPSYQVYKGTVFELVDQSLDFVMSKLNLSVGTRSEGAQAPIRYEIPREVVAEAMVNAVAHRDYTSHGSVQVMLFSDRLEIWNPGRMPATLTLEQLRLPHGSIPANPLLAESLYLAGYIERMGTGTRDMIRRCTEAGLREPEFQVLDGFVITLRRTAVLPSTPPVTPPVTVLLRLLDVAGELGNAEIRKHLALKDRTHLRERYLAPCLAELLIEQTIPDKPNSRLQRYRLTAKGKALMELLKRGKP